MVSIGPTIGIKGESAYTNAMKRIIAETKNLDSEMTLLTSSFKKNDSAIENNKKKQELLTRQMEGAQRQLLIMKDGLDLATKKQTEAKQAVEKAQKAHEEATKTYDKESKEVEKTKAAWEAASNQYNITTRDVERFSEKVNLAQAEINKLEREMENLPKTTQLVGEAMAKWGDAFEQVGSSMTRYITTPLVAAGGAFVKWSSDFTDGMAKIYTIADEGKKPMSEMREELIQLSNSSGYSLEDLAEAEYQAVSASVDTSKAVTFLTDATRLARGGFTSTTQAVDLLTTVINAYGYQAEDAAYISDVLLRTQNDGKTVVDELAHSMGTVIPTAANYNVSLEQLAAAYATMTKQGVNTSRATTFLNAMFTELEKESSTISKTLDEKTGKSFAQLMGEGKDLSYVLGVLYDAVDGDNEQFQRLFGNIRSGKAAAALLTDDFGILNYETERMADALGQTDHAMEVLETPSLKVKRALQQLKNSGMELGTALINTLAPSFEKVINAIKNLTDAFAKFDENSMGMILGFAGIVAATGPLLTIVGKLTTGIGALLAGIAAGTLPLSTTIGLVVGLAEGLGALFVAASVREEQRRKEITDLYAIDEETQALIDKSAELNEQYHASKEAIADKQEANLAELGYAENLIERYNNLIDADGKVIEGKERIADIILNELAEALGMEKEQIKELIEENGKFGASIDETIEKMKERAQMAAAEEYLTEAYKRLYEAQVENEKISVALAQADRDKTNAAEELDRITREVNDATAHGTYVTQEQKRALEDAQTAYSAACKKEEELQAQKNETSAVIEECQADIESANAAIVNSTQKTVGDMAKVIHGGGSSVGREAKYVANQAKDNLSVDTSSVGYYFVTGFSGAISSWAYLAANAASSMVAGATQAARNRLSIESPSKVMAEVGKYFDLGFSKGINDNMKEVEQSANMLANSAIGGVQMVGYEPPTTYHNVSAPISITLNVEGNVDGDDRAFTRNIAEDLANLITRQSEVFA